MMLSELRTWATDGMNDGTHGSTWTMELKIRLAFLLVLIHVVERWKILNGID